MGVDIATYRGRIGTFKHAFGQNVVTQDVLVDVPLFRRIIIWEMLCVLMIIMSLLETSYVFKCPHEFKNTVHGFKCDYWHVADTVMPLTLHFVMEVIGYSVLITAVLPQLYSTHTGISTSFEPNLSRKYICKDSKIDALRHMLTAKTISIFCMVGSVSFIGMLLLMAGVEPNPGPNGAGKNTCKSKPTETEVHPLLKRLDLDRYFPGKIKLFDVISIGHEDIVSLEGRQENKLPWTLLRKLMSLNENAFRLDSEEKQTREANSIDDPSNDDDEDSDSFDFDESPTDTNTGSDVCIQSKAKLNYLDVFLLVYQCCCPMLQQLLFQKMFLCRFAVPFLFTSLTDDKHIVSLWPMRSLVVDNSAMNDRIREHNVLDLPTKCIAFCRIGRPELSKSQLLNIFVLDQSSKTFFNYSCQSGNVSKSVCVGYVETFWLLKEGTKVDKFDDATMVLNMRGCVSSFGKQKVTFVSRFVDAISVFIQKDELIERKGELENITSLYKTVIIVIVGSSAKSINTFTQNLSKYAKNHKCTVSFIETYDRKERVPKCEIKITEEIVDKIKKQSKSIKAKSIETRLKYCAEAHLCSDETFDSCRYGETFETRAKESTEAHICTDEETEACTYGKSPNTVDEEDCTTVHTCSNEQVEECQYGKPLETRVNESTKTHKCRNEKNEACRSAKTFEIRVTEFTEAQMCFNEQDQECKNGDPCETPLTKFDKGQLCTNEQLDEHQYDETIEKGVEECRESHTCTDEQVEGCQDGKLLETLVPESTTTHTCTTETGDDSRCDKNSEIQVSICTEAQISIIEHNEEHKNDEPLETAVKELDEGQICTNEQVDEHQYDKTIEKGVEEFRESHTCTDEQVEGCQHGKLLETLVPESTTTHICTAETGDDCRCDKNSETQVSTYTEAQISINEHNKEHKNDEPLETAVKELDEGQICTNEQVSECQYSNAIEKRAEACTEAQICTDELTEGCQYGKTKALEFCEMVELETAFLSVKENVTPVQSSITRELGKLLKEVKREKDIKKQEKTREKINTVREKMKSNITEPIKQVLNVLCDDISLEKIDYFLAWLGFFISRRARRHQSNLKLRQKEAWEDFHKRKHKQLNIDEQKLELRKIESEVDAASFSVGHLFREIGLIYDTVCELKLVATELNIPSVEHITSVMGKLMGTGRQLELIDGDSFYFPQKWLSKIFLSLDKEIPFSKIMTISVLGIQSSGKSTLLNTMFGALFSTSAGRCTRGINAQLIPLHADFVSRRSDCQYILILDTEGLRPTEVIHENLEHDNELATLIAGLGNITIVNVMGENTQEIRDILQIVAHAFLRIKLANKNITLRNRCLLVQQNITDSTAKDKLHDGLNKFITSLDDMTLDSARCEGVEDICTFNQVINFDIASDVKFLKNVWHGDPPFARVNQNYSEEANKIQMHIFKQLFNVKSASYTTLDNFVWQTYDLWQGVLSENFVFSFKNSLERKAYLQMDEFIQHMLWEIELSLTKQMHSTVKYIFSNCHTLEEIGGCEENINRQLATNIEEKNKSALAQLEKHFETSQYYQIIIQWNESQRGRIQRFFEKIHDILKTVIRNERNKIKTKLRFHDSKRKSEEEFQKETLDYAKHNSVKGMTKKEIKKLFRKLWTGNFGNDDPSDQADQSNLNKFFHTCLFEIHKTQEQILQFILEQWSWYDDTIKRSHKALHFEKIGIDENDINSDTSAFVFFRRVSKNKREAVKQIVETLFKSVTENIETMCAHNDQISESHVRELLYDFRAQELLKLSDKDVKVKEKFHIKLNVHLSIFAKTIFEEHNNIYKQTLCMKFNTYKRQQELLFEECLEHRQTEDTVTEIITDIISKHIETESNSQMSMETQSMLHGVLPSNKNRLIVEMCTDMIDAHDFKQIISYVQFPFLTAQKWLEEKALRFLFEGNPTRFSESSLRIVAKLFTRVELGLKSLQKNDDEMITTEELLDSLHFNLKENVIFIPISDFESVLSRDKVSKVNLSAVCNTINDKLEKKIANLKSSFRKYTNSTVWWEGKSPYQLMFERIWGCSEFCPYCKEPCEKSSDLHTEDHTCVQHRPTCCSGMSEVNSKQACSETCNYDIHAKRTHECSAFDYQCNGEASDCEQKVHQYRDYRIFLKNWYIPPSSDMHDSSKFWLWFAGKFKKELGDRYGYKTDAILDSWANISAEDAKESLRKTYG